MMPKSNAIITSLLTLGSLLWASPIWAQDNRSAEDDGWISLDDVIRQEGLLPTDPETRGAETQPEVEILSKRPFIPQDLSRLQSQRTSLAAGDQFRLTVVGHTQLSRIYAVDQNGETEVELLGPLIVRGLALDDLATNIERLYNQKYLQNASVRIDHYAPPVTVAIASNDAVKASISVPPQSTLVDVMKQSGKMAQLSPTSVIVIKDMKGRPSNVLRANALNSNGYQGPTIAAGHTIMIGEWHKVISDNQALKNTPYLNAMMQRSLQLPSPF